jgi:predicted AlkP superfamily pyrophosphatase or phosphodiesterase
MAAPVASTATTRRVDSNDAGAPLVEAGADSIAASGRALVVISVDGLRHDYLAQKDRAPSLHRLMTEGAAAKSLRSVWPSVTYPAHTTLVTGVPPLRHGIFNNVVFDPFEKNDHGWYWYASDIRVPTLWDAARDAGMEVGSVYWPVTVGADIRYNVPQIWRSKTDEDDKLLAALSTHGILPKDKPPPAEHRTDRERTDTALSIMRTKHPRLMFVYLTDLDTEQHEHGPFSPDALRTLRAIDTLVEELVTTAATEYPKLTVALVSDHGFADVTKDVRPNVALRQKGLLSVASGKVQSYRAVTWKAGGTAAIMPRDPDDEKTRRAVRDLFTTLAKDPANGIANIMDGRTLEGLGGLPSAIVMLEARRGYMFTDAVEPPFVTPSKYRGNHGYSPDMPEMRATFFLWGDGVTRGVDLGEVDMIDVAPTLATLLGLQLTRAEGKVLSRALTR